jgi:putrescine aminotransferase
MNAPAKLANDPAAQTWQQDHAHFVHPWTHFDSFQRDGSLVIERGQGSHVFDAQGRRYLDGIGGLWCMTLGHGVDELAEVMASQARKLAYFSTFVDTTNPPAAALAAELAALAPGDLNRVFFACTGSDANDTAIRLAHYYFGRQGRFEKRHVISRVDAYHGSTLLGMSLTGRAMDKAPEFHYLSDFVHHVSSPNPYRRPDGMTVEQFSDHLVAELEAKILEIGPERVAAFIAEPILGAGGVIVPPPGYHKATRELCRRHDVLYISDEVVTAFGRLGEWFASESVFGIDPDIVVTAKGLSSGYIPLAATIYSERIHQVIAAPSPHAWFTHGFTYSGHPVACAVGLKNIELMKSRGVLENVRRVGPYLQARLRALADLPLVGDVRGSHFMQCTEYVADKATRRLLPDEVNVGKRISDHCEKHGLIIRPLAHLNIMSPPLVLTQSEADELVEGLAAGIRATADDLVREGLRLS